MPSAIAMNCRDVNSNDTPQLNYQIQEICHKQNNNSDANNNYNYQLNTNSIIHCCGCGELISSRDRDYLLAVDSAWHCHCLKCHHCGQILDGHLTCFSREGLIYCKNDYYQLFWQKCVRCLSPITPQQLVMRIIDNDGDDDDNGTSICTNYYHVECFTCFTCNVKLQKGDYFGKHKGNVFCQHHFQLIIEKNKSITNGTVNCNIQKNTIFNAKRRMKNRKRIKCINHPNEPVGVSSSPAPPPLSQSPTTNSFITSSPTPTSASPQSQSQLSLSSATNPCHELSPLQSVPSIVSITSESNLRRPKRMRTSFKHQQLRTMKEYFNLNHNPDSKLLKQLATKTQLSKRVLQVWFQNQRAKWRRSLLRKTSVGPQIVEECHRLSELNQLDDCDRINDTDHGSDGSNSFIIGINVYDDGENNDGDDGDDKEATIINEEQIIVTYTNLY